MLRSATSAFTRVFDALWRCAAEPGSKSSLVVWVPTLRSSATALHRVRGTIICLRLSLHRLRQTGLRRARPERLPLAFMRRPRRQPDHIESGTDASVGVG